MTNYTEETEPQGRTFGDELVYQTMGLSAGILGRVLGGLERVAEYFPDNGKTKERVHEFSGPMIWVSNYITGSDKVLKVERGSEYYQDWLESLANALFRRTLSDIGRKYNNTSDLPKIISGVNVCDFLTPFEDATPEAREVFTNTAREALREGVQYVAGNRGLHLMIGGATVHLDENGRLVTRDKFDFNKESKLQANMPSCFRPFFKLASRISPRFNQGFVVDDGEYSINDTYFSGMGGNEFTTVLEGPVTDLNQFGWVF